LHKLAIARLSALVLLISLALPFALLRVSAAQDIVSVLYAGSLVTPMEGPVKAALLDKGIAFEGQSGGSKELANLIASGIRSPDVFISVNPALVKNLGDKVASATTFAGTSLGVAWAPNSKYAAVFERAAKGDMPLEDALETPDLRIGRTDPKLDPKGAYTITGVKMWLGDEQEQHLLGPEENTV
jgi:molybdate/tungstate transport system substrate-binding protein